MPPAASSTTPTSSVPQPETGATALTAVSDLAELLLAPEPWHEVIEEALARLGHGTGASRVVLLRTWREDGELYGGELREWTDDPAFSLRDAPELQAIGFRAAGFGRWERELLAGRVIAGRTTDFPAEERALLEAFGVASCVIAPVTVNGDLWGWLGFDDCVAARDWDPGQIAAVEAAARILASAIARQRDHDLLLETDERLTRIMESVPVGIAFIAADGSLTFANKEAEEILAVRPSDFADRTYDDPRWRVTALDGGEFPLEQLPAAQVLATGEPVTDVRHAVHHEDGTRIALSVNAAPLRGRDGELVGVMATLADITLQQAHEQALLAAADELSRSNEDLQRFAYAASHDLQEPLRMITSFLALLERKYSGQLDEEAREYIEFAVDGARRLQAMITDLLEYSRVETRGGTSTPTSLTDALDRAMANLHTAIAESDAQVSVEGELPAVLADQGQLVLLLQNLLGNAIKFRRGPGPVIQVGSTTRGEQHEIWVRDDGIGLDPAFAERIFEVFQRLHTREDYPGTGIGLAVCKRVVERHGGRIWVDGRPGEGATFRFTLPAVPS